MIRIRKPTNIPAVLSSRGVQKTKELCEHFVQYGDHAGSDAGKFKYDPSIYAHDEVKEMLCQAQSNKCCYCETRIGPGDYPTIEHYRPKGSVRQSKESPISSPGYYWLAYDWNNLLVCCWICNTEKGILFPLADESNRARSHLDFIEDERPLLVHPAIEEPDIHFYFDESTIRPRTSRGEETIACLKLNRPNLEEDRREWLEKLRCLLKVLMLAQRYPQICKQEVEQQIESMVKEKYSAFARQLRKEYK